LDEQTNLPDMNKIKSGTERKAEFKTSSGIPVKATYTPEDIKDLDFDRDIGEPGQPPYVRGIFPTMYRGKLWSMRQFAGLNLAESTNERFKFLLQMGMTGLAIAPDNAAIMGYDPDMEEAKTEVGVGGVGMYSLLDFEDMFDGIDISNINTAVIEGITTACPHTAMYFAMAEKRGIDLKLLGGTTEGDPCSAGGCGMMAGYGGANRSGDLGIPFKDLMRLCGDLVEYTALNVPKWHPVSFTSYNYRESGVNAYQEIGGMISSAIAVVDEVLSRDRGLTVDDFVGRFTFHMASHSDFFEEICKMRAAKRMWCKIMTEKYGAKHPQAQQLRFHIHTSGSTLTYQQPINNAIRVAYQVMQGALAGSQSIHACSYDEALAIPSEESALLSVRTQQILQCETGIANTIDPLAGSYYVEWLTNEMEKRAWEFFDEIERHGGWVGAVDSGWLRQQTDKEALKYDAEIVTGEREIVGVNCYTMEEELHRPSFFKKDTDILEKQRARMAKLKAERDNDKVKAALDELAEATKRGDNVMPSVMKAIREYATLGEIMFMWRDIFAPQTVGKRIV
jgi:methylmalonyl-CoA mutase N-terminal domain/subunit